MLDHPEEESKEPQIADAQPLPSKSDSISKSDDAEPIASKIDTAQSVAKDADRSLPDANVQPVIDTTQSA
jgi:hypothetical protein